MNKDVIGVILQPGYLPWLGFFDLMAKADVFVIFDNVQFTKRDWRTRNRIKFNDQPFVLTVPVKTAGIYRHDLKINQVEIDYGQDWQNKHIQTIQHAYQKAEYFQPHADELFEILSKERVRLVDLLMPIIHWINNILDIKTKVIFSSDLNIDNNLKKSDQLIAVCQAASINHYLTGDAAKDYISVQKFNDHNMNVYFHNYQHPKYKQLGQEFMPYLSVIDLIFNCGPQAKKLFKNKLTLS